MTPSGHAAPPASPPPAASAASPTTPSSPPADPAAAARGRKRVASKPLLRVDELSLAIERTAPDGVRFVLSPPRPVTAAHEHWLPVFEGWRGDATLVVRASGLCVGPFVAALDVGGARPGRPVQVEPSGEPAEGAAGEASGESRARPFEVEFRAPLRALTAGDEAVSVGLFLEPGARLLPLFELGLAALAGAGPQFASLDLREATDALLFDAPERRLFDLQNPEEGFWAGTGKWRLRLFAEWAHVEGEPFAIEPRPFAVAHAFQRRGDASDLLHEDPTRRAASPRRTYTELVFDSSHAELGPVPPEGKDVPLDLCVEHALTFGGRRCTLSWRAGLPLRVRDPAHLVKAFQRLSAVGVDFGTTSTVAALYQRGFRSLLRLGSPATPGASPAENPTYVLVEDHERLWAEMASGRRFPNLLRVARGSHAAREAMAESPNAVVGELKSLPERVVSLDQPPQLRDRERQRDFLLDEARVRALVRAYAYLLGRAINRPGQDVYLQYWLTHPAAFDERSRALLEEEIRAGLMLSIPEGISADLVRVSMPASEPEAFAAEVCPELAAHPLLEPIVSRFGELRFAVFDFGGGTLDIACGRFRPATEAEEDETGTKAVVETLQVGGDDHLGGDYLTHELVWLTHQHDKHLPEMEEKEVPMMRPQTVPPDHLANKPYLYKRSVAARQNMVRFQRELGLERVKFRRENAPRRAEGLAAARADGSETRLESLKTDLAGWHQRLSEHLEARVRDGAKLLANMLRNTAWGGEGDWREQGVVVLLAGNSSRGEYVERALAEELGAPGLKVWRPGSEGPFQQVVLFETPARVERGVTVVGVTPKTAVALGALKIANREVGLVRRAQGFSFFLGDLRGFPPKFKALVPMGAPVGDPSVFGPHYVDFGRWDAQMPLRLSREYAPAAMTSNDPRLLRVPTGLPPGSSGRLYVCVVKPDEVALLLQREGQEPLTALLNLAHVFD